MTQLTQRFTARGLLLRTVILSGFALFAGFLSTASAEELIREFKGRESRTTAEFEVEAPWIIDWRTRGDYPGSMAFELILVHSPSGQYAGKVATTKWVDNGVRLFNESGRYKLQVDTSLMDWTIRIQQLSKQEAEGYTVRQRKASPDFLREN